jgi:hypothetical protein
MTKTKPVKKRNLKLRKQIRRTFGTLFLVSAIVVAAIPVDPIEAGEKWDAIGTSDNRGDARYPSVVDSSSDGWVTSESFLAKPTAPPTPDETSYTIYELSSAVSPFTMVPQYYYSVHDTIPNTSGSMAIINGYNDTLPEGAIQLSNYLAKAYFIVKEQEYEDFFLGNGPGAEPYEYSYQDYLLRDSPIKTLGKTEAMQYIEQQDEWRADYEAYKAQCARYYQYAAVDYPAYLTALSNWVNGGQVGNRPAEPNEVAQPGGPRLGATPAPTSGTPTPPPNDDTVGNPFVRTPRTDLSDASKLKAYCKWAESLHLTEPSNPKRIPGEGFTLVPVQDQQNNELIFVPQGGTVSAGSGAELDGRGFLVKTVSPMVIGIGDEAFKGVGNVEQLTIPNEIKYIGDDAFASSFIKSIDFGNVTKIGNRAFKECTELTSISFNSGAREIGAEAFYGSGISEVTFPPTVNTIGTGAFAESQFLTTVDMSQLSQNLTEIHSYAFYECARLNEVKFPEIGNSFDIGEGCFALRMAAQGVMTTITLPPKVTGKTGSALGNYLFAGRQGLKSVIMPTNYGTDPSAGTIQIPSGMFRMCTGLDFVEFPNVQGSRNGGFASYQYSDTITDPNYPRMRDAGGNIIEVDDGSGNMVPIDEPYMGQCLFLDVTNPDFYVRGPEYSTGTTKALPRRSTWGAFTQVSDFIPYKYVNTSGVECYEVSDGVYILQADDKGRLTDCELVDDGTFNGNNYVDLVIPAMVGDIAITDIADSA